MTAVGFHISQLISLVKDQPVLWDKTFERKCRRSVLAAWKEVCLALYPDFNSLSPAERKDLETLVVKKWYNVKDCWVRKKKAKMMNPESTVKKYVYEDQLTFLYKNIGRGASANHEPADIKESLLDPAQVIPTIPSIKEDIRTLTNRRLVIIKGPSRPSEVAADVDMKPPQISKDLENSEELKNCQQSSEELKNRHQYSEELKNRHQSSEELKNRHQYSEEHQNRHLSFFRAILPSLEELDEDQVLQFQTSVLSSIQSIRSGGWMTTPQPRPHSNRHTTHHITPQQLKISKVNGYRRSFSPQSDAPEIPDIDVVFS